MHTDAKNDQRTHRPEISGAGLLTVCVLLLLLGGVDRRSTEAIQRAATGLVAECVAAEEALSLQVESVAENGATRTRIQRPVRRGAVVVKTIADGWLPAPRAPDRVQVS